MRLPPLTFRIFASCVAMITFGGACQPKPSDRVPSIANGTPLVVTMPSGRTDMFVLGSDGNVWQSTCRKDCTKRSSFSSWTSGPGRPPGGATSDPGGVAWGEDRIDLFIRGAISNVWHQTFADGRWFGWEDLDGRTASYPIASSWSQGRIDLFALCGDNRLWHRYCNAGDTQPTCRALNWAAWSPDPGGPGVPAITTGDAVGSNGSRIDMAVRGNDGALWFQRWESSYWIGWRSLGGELASSPALVSNGGRVEAYAMNKSGQLARAFIDSIDAPLAWTPANVELGGEPRGVTPYGQTNTLVVSKPGGFAIRGVTCVPGAECAPLD